MRLSDWSEGLDALRAGEWAHALMAELFPICRSITGNGVRESLTILQKHIPLEIHEVATGTPVFDWTVPREWNVRDGYIKDASGKRLIDFNEHNLHVLNYSQPVDKKVTREELESHCFTIPDHPDRIPYRTSYYNEDWGFCLSKNQLDSLGEGPFDVCVDATIEDGHLTYGEYVIPGESDKEFLITSHICHPSLANDNLSSVSIAVYLAKELAKLDLRFTYRFVFAPATIGAITWLAANTEKLAHIKHALCLACTGDPGAISYKNSRRGDADIDTAIKLVLSSRNEPYTIDEYTPWGYDERQYCSPGIDLPLGCFMRSKPGGYGEYHSSADNLDLVQPEYLADSLSVLADVLALIENSRSFRNTSPECEPQLGRRGLYEKIGGTTSEAKTDTMSLLWVMNYSDGQHALPFIADKSGISMDKLESAAEILMEAGLLESTD
jgi:aminopeptidase-like protein